MNIVWTEEFIVIMALIQALEAFGYQLLKYVQLKSSISAQPVSIDIAIS